MPADPSKLTVGFIGLGRMGRPMASNIARRGFPLYVYNRTRSTAADFANSAGALLADSPAELASTCDVIITMVADGVAVDAVYSGPAGVMESIGPGKIGIDMSTIGPEAVMRLGVQLQRRGARLVDAPVSGSVAFAEKAELTVMAGGSSDDVEAVRPVLSAMGSRVFHVGALGRGATLKLAVNGIVYGLSEALSEALVLAERAGIERETAYEVFASSAIAAPFVHYRRAAFERPGEVPVASRLAIALKDMNLLLALSEQLQVPAPQAETNQRVLDEAAHEGFQDHDVSAVAEYLRGQASKAGRQ
jgi:3-hydroxyisobutyrate dehydrogenase-like beta-hydroxyacid dehydrogenase